MKKTLLLAALFTLLLITGRADAKVLHGGYGVFYTSLAPHGTWIELDDGLVVWHPASVRRSWAPYRDGQWIWTEDGWYWDSYEPFGHITYHYGRWYYDDYYGWIWVPDNEWAPSWVEWRYDDDYIGWAPLPPYAIFSVDIGIRFSIDYHSPYHHWHFVKYRYFCDPYVNKYYIAPKYKNRIYERTKYRTNYGYEHGRVVNRGVDFDHVNKRSGQNIRMRTIERTSDIRDLERSGRSNNERVRTFVASRDELNREAKDIEIKRGERKSSLKSGNVEIGERRSAGERNTERKPNSREEKKVSTRELERTREEGIRNQSSGNDNQRKSEVRVNETNRNRKLEDKGSNNNSNKDSGRNIRERETKQQAPGVLEPKKNSERKNESGIQSSGRRNEQKTESIERRTNRGGSNSGRSTVRERRVESNTKVQKESSRVERNSSNSERTERTRRDRTR